MKFGVYCQVNLLEILPKQPCGYTGTNMEFEDWEERVEALLKCNEWSLNHLLEVLPISLTGSAKHSFDTLKTEEKGTKKALFDALRIKIAPETKGKNMRLFVAAKKNFGESVTAFVDRCKMYVRRSGGDPEAPFAIELLKTKVIGSLQPNDRTILQATMSINDDLDRMIITADSMINSRAKILGEARENLSGHRPVIEELIRDNQSEECSNHEQAQDQRRTATQQRRLQGIQSSFRGFCGKCHLYGHSRRYCPSRMDN